MSFILLFEPTFLFAIAAITRTKIKIGATARKPLTKSEPRTPTFSAKLKPKTGSKSGLINAVITPRINHTRMRFTKLPWKKREIKRELAIIKSLRLRKRLLAS